MKKAHKRNLKKVSRTRWTKTKLKQRLKTSWIKSTCTLYWKVMVNTKLWTVLYFDALFLFTQMSQCRISIIVLSTNFLFNSQIFLFNSQITYATNVLKHSSLQSNYPIPFKWSMAYDRCKWFNSKTIGKKQKGNKEIRHNKRQPEYAWPV